MAEIFDASGIAGGGGVDFTHAINATLESFKNAGEQLTGAADDLSHSAYVLEKATDKLTAAAGKMAGVGGSASGSQFAIPFAKKIPTGTPLESPGLPSSGPAKSPAGAGGSIAPKAASGENFSIGSALGELAPATKAVTGAFAAATAGAVAFAASITGAVFAARHFTEFINPAAVQAFDAAMRDLGAVVGTLLQPLLVESTRYLREFAAYLYPIVQQLLPSFTQVVRSIAEAWVGQLPILANLASVFVGIAGAGADLVRLFVDVMLPIYRAISAVTAGLAAAFKSFLPVIGGDLRGTFKTLGETVALVGIALTGLAFKFLGMNDALGAMLNDLKNGPAKADATGLAVATNARYTDPASLGKELAQRAFVSSGRGDQPGQSDPQAEFRAKAVEVLDKIKGGGFARELAKAFVEELASSAGDVAGAPLKILGKLNPLPALGRNDFQNLLDNLGQNLEDIL